MFHHYRRLIELRHTLPVVVHGDYRLLLPSDENVFAYVRTLGEERLRVVANLSGESVEVDLGDDADLLAGEVLLTTHDDGSAPEGGSLTLAPWESRAVLTLRPERRQPSASA